MLDMIAFVTSARVQRHRIKQIIDCTPTSGTRDCLVWADSIEHKDPQPYLDDRIVKTIERLMQSDLPPAVRRALRWYRFGVLEKVVEDQFQYFWFALEILAEHNKTPVKIPDKSPQCKSPLYCETCKTHPTHKPYAKQAIRSLIRTVDSTCSEVVIDALDQTRNSLMHGSTLKDIETELPDSDQHIVDILGRVLVKALLFQFPRNVFEDSQLLLARPSTYTHGTLSGIVHVQTIGPQDDNGELDLDRFTGFKASMVTDDPPQSGLAYKIVITPDQQKQLESLMRENGNHQYLCKGIFRRIRMKDGKLMSLVLSTDMPKIKDALVRAEKGKWQDLLREIISENPHLG
jgi:hypothetical protein